MGRVEGKLDGLIDKINNLEDKLKTQDDLEKKVADLRYDLTFFKRVAAGVGSVATVLMSSDFVWKLLTTFAPR